MSSFSRKGILFAVSAPSGTGKSTLCYNLRHTPDFEYSVSCTTRAPRRGEVDGEDYIFMTKEKFEEDIQRNAFLEYALVHGCYYGTPKEQVLNLLESGTDVLLDIDVNGVRQLREQTGSDIRASLVDVFIMPPDLKELEKRLRKRKTETEEQIQGRLQTAAKEIPLWKEYRYTIISGSMEEDLIKFRAIMRAERYLSRRLSFNDSD